MSPLERQLLEYKYTYSWTPKTISYLMQNIITNQVVGLKNHFLIHCRLPRVWYIRLILIGHYKPSFSWDTCCSFSSQFSHISCGVSRIPPTLRLFLLDLSSRPTSIYLTYCGLYIFNLVFNICEFIFSIVHLFFQLAPSEFYAFTPI